MICLLWKSTYFIVLKKLYWNIQLIKILLHRLSLDWNILKVTKGYWIIDYKNIDKTFNINYKKIKDYEGYINIRSD